MTENVSPTNGVTSVEQVTQPGQRGEILAAQKVSQGTGTGRLGKRAHRVDLVAQHRLVLGRDVHVG